MKIVKQKIEILSKTPYEDAVKLVEGAGRTCYKSASKDTVEGAEQFITGIIKSGHGSVIEHFNMTVKITTDRGVSHQLVRHRLMSVSQESTRYCNYSNDKHGNEISVVNPGLKEGSEEFQVWKKAMEEAEEAYMTLIKQGVPTDIARSVLPTCTKTEIVLTANAREWRHIISIRKAKDAHPQIREVAEMLLEQCKEAYPVFFRDLKEVVK